MTDGHANEVATLRDRIAALKSERTTVQPNAIPLDEAIAKSDAWVDRLAAGVMSGLRSFSKGATAPHRIVDAAHLSTDEQIAAVVAWSNPTAFKKRAASALRAYYEDNQLVTADASNRLAEIDRELFEAEVSEERIISRGEEAGVFIARRMDMNPKAILAASEADSYS